MTKVLITGITGQDGSYLAEKLLARGYDVHGLIRRSSTGKSNFWRINEILDKVTLHFGDLTDHAAIADLLHKLTPDEVYNLAAQSQVGISYQCPSYTLEATGVGACNLMESTFAANPKAKFYQASSSEMWGRTGGYIHSNEQSPLRPISPYACAKVLAHNYAIMLAKRGYFATVGILNNHESERRGDNFVTTKVCKAAANWQPVNLGYLGAVRDWGYAPEYVDGMILMMAHERPDVFVLGTGVGHSVAEFVDEVYRQMRLDPNEYVVHDEKLVRPDEAGPLIGDYGKAMSLLGWEPKTDFRNLITKLLVHWKDKKEHEKIISGY